MAAARSGYVYEGGDQAVIELATRRAVSFAQLVGPYDRFGWHHPGPIYFYFLSIFYRIFGPGARPDLIGEVLIFGVAAVAIVGVVYRKAGGATALWAAALVLAFCVILGPLRLEYPWNPLAVLVPMILTVILAAAAMAGSALWLLAAALVGSFVVQTDVSTLPLTALVLVLGAACLVARRAAQGGLGAGPLTRFGAKVPKAPHRATLNQGTSRALAGAAVVGLIAMWIPPLIQEVNGPGPGNLGTILRFFTHAPSPHLSLSAAVRAVAAVDALLPLGARTVLGQSIHSPATATVLAVTVVIGLAAVGLGWRRRQWFALSLGVVSLVGLLASIVAITRIVGGVSGYLVLWEIAVPLAGVIGLGAGIFAPRVHREALSELPGAAGDQGSGRWRLSWIGGRLTQGGTVAMAALASLAASAGLLFQLTNLGSPPGNLYGSGLALAWQLVAPHAGVPHDTVLVDMGTPDSPQYFIGAGLVDRLEAAGFRASVPAGWSTQFGEAQVVSGRPQATIVLASPSARIPAGFAFLGNADATTAIYVRLGIRSHDGHRFRVRHLRPGVAAYGTGAASGTTTIAGKCARTNVDSVLRQVSEPGKPLVAVVGASISAGIGATCLTDAWPYILSQRMGWHLLLRAVPGAGYVAPGRHDGGPLLNELVGLHLLAEHPSIVILQAGHDDLNRPSATLKAHVATTIARVLRDAPGARLVVVTLFTGGVPSPAELRTNATIIVTTRKIDPGALIVSPIAEHWAYRTIAGRLHPSDAGNRWIARRIQEDLQANGIRPATA